MAHRNILLGCLCFLSIHFIGMDSVSGAECNKPPKKIFLSRHACRLDLSSDSPLNSFGWIMAGELAAKLDEEPISVSYTTEKVRSKETAHPLVSVLKGKKKEVKTIEISKGKNDELASKICNDQPGKTLVVVAHSDTITPIVKKIGVTANHKLIKNAARQYGKLFVITFDKKHPLVKIESYSKNVSCKLPSTQ